MMFPNCVICADIIIKCNVIGQEAFVKTGSSIYTDYEVKIEEIYKGDNMPDVIHLELWELLLCRIFRTSGC